MRSTHLYRTHMVQQAEGQDTGRICCGKIIRDISFFRVTRKLDEVNCQTCLKNIAAEEGKIKKIEEIMELIDSYIVEPTPKVRAHIVSCLLEIL